MKTIAPRDSRVRRIGLAAFLMLAAYGDRLGAQGPASAAPNDTVVLARSDDRAEHPRLRRRVVVLGIAVAATAAIAPFDLRSAAFFQSPHMQNAPQLQNVASDLAFMGGPGPFLLGATLFAGGRATGAEGATDLGVHLTEGVLLAASVTAIGKGIVGRAIPQDAGGDPDNFQLGRGFHHGNGPYVSFPSGHTAAAFAMAAVLTAEADRREPGVARVIAPLAYGGATLIGLARMYQNVHWASDLPLAAAIGTWSGLTVVGHQHAHPGNRLDRWLLGVVVAPSPRGAMLGWSAPAGVAPR